MENIVHTQIRQIGYHNSSKSQVNILSSPSLISNNKIFETDINNDNKRKENVQKLIDIINKNIMFLKTKLNTKISGDDYSINFNRKLKNENENLRKKISVLEINYNTFDDNNIDLTQNSPIQYNSKIDFLKKKNQKLKEKNRKLKQKLYELSKKTGNKVSYDYLITNKEEIISKIKNINYYISSFYHHLDKVKKNNNSINYLDNESYENKEDSINEKFKYTECENLYESKDFEESNKVLIPLKKFENKNKTENINITNNIILDKGFINNPSNNTNRTTRTEGKKNNIFNINKGLNNKNGIYPSNITSSNIRNRNFKSKGLNGRMGNKVKEKYLKK